MATAQFRFESPQFVGVKRKSRPAGLQGASFSNIRNGPAVNYRLNPQLF